MSSISLNALHFFVMVARHESYTSASRAIGVTASALSQSVRSLEEQLGVTLLNRTTRSVSLTDQGRRLLETAGPAVDQAIEALRTVTFAPGEVTGRLRLTVPTAAVSTVLVRVVPRFVALHPCVELEIRVEDHFVDSVAEGLDAGIRLIEAIDLDMVQIRLTKPGRLIVCAAPAYFERHGRPETPEDLLRHNCICMLIGPSGERIRWSLERDGESWEVPVRGPVSTNDFPLMRDLAVAGVGLYYTLEEKIVDEIAGGILEVVMDEYAVEVPGLFLYFPSRTQISPALKAFVEVAREVMGEVELV